jgi:hypothetical protein
MRTTATGAFTSNEQFWSQSRGQRHAQILPELVGSQGTERASETNRQTALRGAMLACMRSVDHTRL